MHLCLVYLRQRQTEVMKTSFVIAVASAVASVVVSAIATGKMDVRNWCSSREY